MKTTYRAIPVSQPAILDLVERKAPTFNALKKCGVEAGDTIAVLGIGDLGHLVLQYARHMGFMGRGARQQNR